VAPGETMQGTLLDGGVQAVFETQEPGVYALARGEGGEITSLWFRLPTGTIGRIAARGHGKPGEDEWEITVNPDTGVVTVNPSIKQEAVSDLPTWHGYLRRGVWEGG